MIREKKTIILLNKSDLDEVVDQSSVDALLSKVTEKRSSVYELSEAAHEEQWRKESENIFIIKFSAEVNGGLDCLVE